MSVATRRISKPELRGRSCRWLVFISVAFALLSANRALCPGAAAPPPPKQISKNKAISLARQITGYPKATIASAKLRQVDGSVFPFGQPKKWLVWEITLKVTIISGLEQDGYIPNPFIKDLTVLLEADTGRLVRIQSVPFDAKGLRQLAGRKPEKNLKGSRISVIGLSSSPKFTFAEEIKESWPSMNPKATAMTAYLVTLHGDPSLPGRTSYWVLLIGGFHAHIYENSPHKAATETMEVFPATDEPDPVVLGWNLP